MNPERVHVVVARYNEDVRWLRWLGLDRIDHVYVFNKGDDHVRTHHAFPMERMSLIKAPNVGREGHTFYSYIVLMYERLPEQIVFLQGCPFDHTPHLVDLVKRFLDVGPTAGVSLGEDMYKCDFRSQGHFAEAGRLPMVDTFKRIFGTSEAPVHLEWFFGAGAQMIIGRETILKRPKSFYQNIVNILGASVDPIEGYCMERLHPFVVGLYGAPMVPSS